MSRTRIYHPFWKLAGEDKIILRDSEKHLQIRFALSGFLIVLLFITAVISYHHTFSQIFNIPNVSWVWSLLFSLMIFNIYKLSLITISANPNRKGVGYITSFLIRISILLLLGLTIIKPIETLLLKRTLNIELAHLKVDEIKKATIQTAAYFDDEIASNNQELIRQKQLLADGRIKNNSNRVELLEAKKAKLLLDKKILIVDTENRIDASPHYVRGLILLNYKFPWVWIISIGFLILFLTPLFLKYFISRSSSYDIVRSELNRDIILDEYDNFKKQFPLLFQNSIGKRIELEERFEDPPFNQIPRTITRNTGTELDFMNYLNGL
ncbi:DUF4407 domain-containing protein [Maribacter aquivivus]|uniref:DUF4407 domain-containing protein n=1 Tax=Maribacter aquivivus TaxID=228958 RepID=UPI002491E026|nr:DUF4407 domain-containing protein [Maribacter aquivivus]